MLLIMNLALTHITLGLMYMLVVRSTSNTGIMHVSFVALHIFFHEVINRSPTVRIITTEFESGVGARDIYIYNDTVF